MYWFFNLLALTHKFTFTQVFNFEPSSTPRKYEFFLHSWYSFEIFSIKMPQIWEEIFFKIINTKYDKKNLKTKTQFSGIFPSVLPARWKSLHKYALTKMSLWKRRSVNSFILEEIFVRRYNKIKMLPYIHVCDVCSVNCW